MASPVKGPKFHRMCFLRMGPRIQQGQARGGTGPQVCLPHVIGTGPTKTLHQSRCPLFAASMCYRRCGGARSPGAAGGALALIQQGFRLVNASPCSLQRSPRAAHCPRCARAPSPSINVAEHTQRWSYPRTSRKCSTTHLSPNWRLTVPAADVPAPDTTTLAMSQDAD
jgi:hypothetical protein